MRSSTRPPGLPALFNLLLPSRCALFISSPSSLIYALLSVWYWHGNMKFVLNLMRHQIHWRNVLMFRMLIYSVKRSCGKLHLLVYLPPLPYSTHLSHHTRICIIVNRIVGPTRGGASQSAYTIYSNHDGRWRISASRLGRHKLYYDEERKI